MSPNLDGITIFTADDLWFVRMRLLLETQPDFKVIGEAANGREAVRQMSRHCPDVAILDIAMPELTVSKPRGSAGCPATRSSSSRAHRQ
jgi:DNA-binding NarL/FixJ family response regulator